MKNVLLIIALTIVAAFCSELVAKAFGVEVRGGFMGKVFYKTAIMGTGAMIAFILMRGMP